MDSDKNKQKKQEILGEQKNVEEAIQKLLLKLKDDKTQNSIECMRIMVQIEHIQPILEQMNGSIDQVSDDKIVEFYRIYRNLLKQFKSEVGDAQKQIQEGTFDKDKAFNKKKLQEIKDLILNISDEIKHINNKVFTPSRKNIIWMDYAVNDEENQIYLKQFLEICNGAVEEFKTFSQDALFQKFVQENASKKQLYIIMSGSAAGYYRPTDGKNLEFLRNFKQSQKGKEFIQGVFIFTSFQRENQFRELMASERNLIKDSTSNPDQMFKSIQDLVFPKNNLRVVPVISMCQYLDKELRHEFLLIKDNREIQEFLSNVQLTEFHPDKPFVINKGFSFFEVSEVKDLFENKNLKQRLQKLKEIVKTYKIEIPDTFINPNELHQDILECFIDVDNQKIATAVLRLYTKESASCFYQLINTMLSVLNQDILALFWDLITLLRTSLLLYDDKPFSKIQPPIRNSNIRETVTLYRGSPIPKVKFEQLYKANQFICMCGFTSFSFDVTVAERFSQSQNINDEQVIFKLDFECGTDQYQLRPKSLEQISQYVVEKEYLMNCGSVFKIKSVTEKDSKKIVEIIL